MARRARGAQVNNVRSLQSRSDETMTSESKPRLCNSICLHQDLPVETVTEAVCYGKDGILILSWKEDEP